MGLPGSGKTTLAEELVKHLMLNNTVSWFNADTVREKFNDWDFSPEGRERQVRRMRELADAAHVDIVICDFVCPTQHLRDIFEPDVTIWLDTIDAGRFEDTNKIFEPPLKCTYRITDWQHSWHAAVKWIVSDLNFKPEKSRRSVAKAVSWRMLGTLDTFLLSWLITGEWRLAAAIGGTEVVTKMILFYLHERVWARVRWGR